MYPFKDRRQFKRYKHNSGFRLSIRGTSFQANTIDYSIEGIGFSVENTPPLAEGEIIDLKIEDLKMHIKGRVIWLQKSDRDIRVGIEKLSIEGLLRDYQVSDILLYLKNNNKTGILEITKGSIIKKIYVKSGNVIFAISNKEEERLGEFLLRKGKITLDQYSKSVDILEKTGKRQGAVLVELGYLKPYDLIWAVQSQVEEIILSLFQWEDGEFIFKECPLPTKEVITLKISTANLIYYGIKRIKSFTRIKNALPPLDSILYYSTDPINLFQDITLDNEEKGIFSLINGKSTIKEIISISPLDNFETMKILYALYSTKILEIKEERVIKDRIHEKILKEYETDIDSVVIEKIENLYKKLGSINYYDILGIEHGVSDDIIKKAYYKSAKDFHPDRHFSLPSVDIQNKLHAIFSKITEAYKTLSDRSMRSEYDQKRLSVGTSKDEKSNIEIAKERFREGKEAMKNGYFTDAAQLFGQAAYLDSSVPGYHYHTGLAYKKIEKFREAEKAIRQALKVDPFNPDYLAELGHIYLKLNLPLRARGCFEKAIKYNPSHKKVSEGLRNFNL